ncbi:GTPase RsgA [Marinomonas sp. S3726]|uniref:small ribosomal subunit biogenesis GTPase RsgA n=1 Tax=Marinomonas sp. S3726 TaxID=579484 RepID=UPI0005FA2B00|nr:small ribosomal subunit biogenesis GTPase RsgA [Marinomonas sp. S3726]KJZ09923.1 GTPase RsgA [Marinomonas sp. S3726]
MSKRKLTKQQTWRIEKIQAERSKRVSKRNTKAEEALLSSDLGPETEGLILSHFGTQVEVESINESDVKVATRCNLRANLGQLVTGDKVVWRANQQEGGVVVARLDRDNDLCRPDMHGRLKPIAANINHIIVVVAAEPLAHANLIDRYLVAAETAGIPPVILLNKIDLIDDSNRDNLDSLLKTYEDLGYQVLRTSTKQKDSMDELYDFLGDKTSVFVGQSGVGKSSLVNTLLPGVDLSVGELSQKRKKGTHTTTTARLFHMPKGGDLIDSPGIREFGLWHISIEELLEGFIEFREHIGYCRFRDCAHEEEPGCALQQAREENKISDIRYQSFLRIKNSILENL